MFCKIHILRLQIKWTWVNAVVLVFFPPPKKCVLLMTIRLTAPYFPPSTWKVSWLLLANASGPAWHTSENWSHWTIKARFPFLLLNGVSNNLAISAQQWLTSAVELLLIVQKPTWFHCTSWEVFSTWLLLEQHSLPGSRNELPRQSWNLDLDFNGSPNRVYASSVWLCLLF